MSKISGAGAGRRGGVPRSHLWPALACGLLFAVPATAQISIQSVECLNDPACRLQNAGSLTDFIEQDAASDAPPKAFLIQRSHNLYGIPPLATDSRVVDYGIPQIDGDPYWDPYGTGALFVAPANGALGGQIWHVNMASKIRRQVTDGSCYPGIGTILDDWRCAYNTPIAVSPAGDLAFIQQVVAAPNAPPETPHWQVAILSKGVGRIVDQYSSRPRSMTWSPDGEWLLIPNGKDLTAISKSSGLVCDYPDVSNRTINYADWGSRNRGEVVYANGGDLWLLSLRPPQRPTRCPAAQPNNQEQLTSTDDQDDRPQWLQPNELIGFISNRAVGGGASHNLWAINPDNPAAPSVFAVLSFPVQHSDWQASSVPANEARIRNNLRN